MSTLSLHSISQKYGFRLAEITENPNEAEMIAYGLEVLMGCVMKITVLFSSAIALGIVNEVALIIFVTGSLRILSGGAHCTAYYRCMVASTTVMLALGGYVKTNSHLLINTPNFVPALLLSNALYLYWRYSPQAPLNKPLPDKEAERKFRSMTVGLALFYSAISLTLGTSSLVSWCITTGVLWQALTLTGPGHKLISLYDNLLIF